MENRPVWLPSKGISAVLPKANQKCWITNEDRDRLIEGVFKRKDNKDDGEPQAWICGMLESMIVPGHDVYWTAYENIIV